MCIWKAWKKVKTKVADLIRCGINKYQAYEWSNTRKGYWRIADSPILTRAINNNNLRTAEYATLMGRISNGTQNRNHRMRNRMSCRTDTFHHLFARKSAKNSTLV